MGGLGAGLSNVTPLPSAAAGIPHPNMISQLMETLGQMPQIQADQKMRQSAVESAALKVTKEKQQAALQKIQQLAPVLRSNPDAAKSPAMIDSIKQLWKEAGLDPATAPITQSVPRPATASGTVTTPAGAPPGGGAPAASDWHAPMMPPNAASLDNSGREASRIGADEAARRLDGPGLTTELPGVREQSVPMVDVNALAGGPDFSTLAAQPSWVKEAMNLTPEARRAAYGSLPGVSDSFLNAPRSIPVGEYVADVNMAKSQLLAFGKGDLSPSTVRAYLAAFGPKLQADGIPISSVLSDDIVQQIGASAQAHISLMRESGILQGKKLDLYGKKLDADIQTMATRRDYMGAQTALAQKRLTWVDQDMQTKIQQRRDTARHQSDMLKVAQDHLKIARDNHDLSKYNHTSVELRSTLTSLEAEMRSLRSQSTQLFDNGQEDAIDSQTGKKIVEENATALVDLQRRADEARKALAAGGTDRQAIVHAMVQDSTKGTGRTATGVSGTNSWTFKPTATLHNRPIGLNKEGTGYVYSDGTPAQ